MLYNLKTYTFAIAVAVLIAAPIPAAWANDTTYAALHAGEPSLAADQGRFYFYREGGFVGAVIQPTIMINGQSAGGRAKPGDYFYVDLPAGAYEIATETEKKEAVTATLTAGQSLYIRFDVSMGFLIGHVSPSIIDPQQALTEIKDCDYHAPKPVPGSATPAMAAASPAPATAPAAAPSAAPATPPASVATATPAAAPAPPSPADAATTAPGATPAKPASSNF